METPRRALPSEFDLTDPNAIRNTDAQEEFLSRAKAAWFRTGGRDQPNAMMSDVEILNGHVYVVLRNVRGTMAVYRLRNDGILRRMVRWPKEFDSD